MFRLSTLSTLLQLNRKIHITLSTEQEVINCAGIPKLQNTAQILTLIIQMITMSDLSYLIDRLGGTIHAAECDILYFP